MPHTLLVHPADRQNFDLQCRAIVPKWGQLTRAHSWRSALHGWFLDAFWDDIRDSENLVPYSPSRPTALVEAFNRLSLEDA